MPEINRSCENSASITVLKSEAKCVLLDIEGTTSSIKFVYDVLFPFVRSEVANFLISSWNDTRTKNALHTMATDAGYEDAEQWCKASSLNTIGPPKSPHKLVTFEVNTLMDQDIKTTGLKELQGLIWDVGFREGKLRSHVYEDVPETLKSWKKNGIDIRIYSSGSITAQKVFFEHTEYGALTEYLNGHYDTTTGPKREPLSYNEIARDIGLPPNKILFLSDMPAELDAARKTGMQAALVCRPGNADAEDVMPAITSFAQIQLGPNNLFE